MANGRTLRIEPSSLHGVIGIPPSKSQAMRAMLFAALGTGQTHLVNLLDSPDTKAMIHACQAMGSQWTKCANDWFVIGVSGKPNFPSGTTINAGNSGLVFRMMTAMAALTETPVEIQGDASITERRPIKPLIDALIRLGAKVDYCEHEGAAPFRISGPIHAGSTSVMGHDSQLVSALLIAATCLDGMTSIEVFESGEKPWVDLTLHWLDRFNIVYQNQNHQLYQVTGSTSWVLKHYIVPSDLSTMAYPIVSSLLTFSDLIVTGIDLAQPQGDKVLLEHLKQMGAVISYDANKQQLHIQGPQVLQGIRVNINDCIDMVTVFAVLGCFAHGRTHITGAAVARYKESNRLEAMQQELKKMGATIELLAEGFIIDGPQPLRGATLESHRDHRVFLALSVAALASSSGSIISGLGWVAKSFPDFVSKMQKVGAKLAVSEDREVLC